MLFIRTVVKQAVGVLLVMLATRDIRLSWAHALESDIDCASTTFRVKLWTSVAWQRCMRGFLIYICIYIYTHTHMPIGAGRQSSFTPPFVRSIWRTWFLKWR